MKKIIVEYILKWPWKHQSNQVFFTRLHYQSDHEEINGDEKQKERKWRVFAGFGGTKGTNEEGKETEMRELFFFCLCSIQLTQPEIFAI